MSPADARHLRRMLECISAMRSGSVSLVDGTDNLLFLRNALEEFEAFGQAWFDDFTAHLVTLESAGLDSRGQRLKGGNQHEAHVTHALNELEAMVRSRFPDGVPPVEDWT